MLFNGFNLLGWIVGLAVLYGCFKLACWIGEAPLIEDAPLSRLDRLDGVGDRHA
jgi:hypothetical protein